MDGIEARMLQGGCDSFNSADGHEITQLIQGVAFLFLSMFLIFVNNGKVSMLQRAPLETRLGVSITLATVVCLFSGFFNLMQLTSLNKIPLPRTSGYTMNLARPIEWLLTCPIMQLILVIIGGPRIPGYRRWMMPGLTASMLICGLAGGFTASGLRFLWFGFGAVVQGAVVYHNVIQISEHSDGEESLMKGVSHFRRLSVKVIIMWYPFPIWYFLSPESLEVITDIRLVNMGWVILNVASKFSFILYLQYMKTTYIRNLEATRELYALNPEQKEGEKNAMAELGQTAHSAVPANGGAFMMEMGVGLPGAAMAGSAMVESEAKLASLVTDTMASLGLSKHGQRLFDLLKKNGITSPDILEKVTEERAMDLSLPWNFVNQVQSRWLAEKVALGDDPDKCEVKKEDPFTKLLIENKEKLVLLQMNMGMQQGYQRGGRMGLGGTVTPPVLGMAPGMPMSSGFDIENILSLLMEKLSEDKSAVIQKLDAQMEVMQTKLEYANDAIGQRMDFGQVTILQSLNNMQAAVHRVDSSQERTALICDAARAAVERMEQQQSQLLDGHGEKEEGKKKIVEEAMSEATEAMLRQLAASFKVSHEKAEECSELLKSVAASADGLSAKADRIEDNTSRLRIEGEGRLARKIEEIGQQVNAHTSSEMKALLTSTHRDLETMARRQEDVAERMTISIAAQEERMGDVRRMNMMVMDTLTNMQERISVSADTIERSSRLAVLQDADAGQSSVKEEVRSALNHHMLMVQSHMEKMMEMLRSMPQRESGEALESILAALSEQQLARSAETVSEVRKEVQEIIRTELDSATKTIAESNEAATITLQDKVQQLKGAIDTGFERVEAGLGKVLAPGASAEQSRSVDKEEKSSRKKEKGGASEQRG